MPTSASRTRAIWSSARASTSTPASQRGSFQIIEGTLGAIVEMFPAFARAHEPPVGGGIVDVSPDACPIISKTPVQGLYFNCGWGTGGFKATPDRAGCTPTPSRATRPTR